MSSAEPFNFGRKIRELKRINKKSYADLTAGLKISRERIVALEESEREPTDTERQRFAAFYNLPIEDFLPAGFKPASSAEVNRPASTPSAAAPRPIPPTPANERPPMAAPYSEERRAGNYNPAGEDRRPGGSNFNAAPRPGGGNFNAGPRPAGGNFTAGPRPAGGPAPRPGGPRPANGATRSVDSPPREPRAPKEPKDNSGEPKPVMKYTAEQLGDIESAYLRKQRDLKVPLRFTFLNGKEYTGVVLDFTPFTVHIVEEGTGEEIILRKLAMAYYRKADSADDKGGS